MTDALRIVGIGTLASVLGMLLREAGFKGAKLIGICAIVALSAYAVSGIGEFSSGLGTQYFGSEIEKSAVLIMKIVGTGYIFGVCSDICRELGEAGLSSAVLIAGRIEILLLALPSFREIIGLGIELMK